MWILIFSQSFQECLDCVTVKCSTTLKPGQYLCTDLDIDEETQQPRDCDRDTEKAPIVCKAAPRIICK